MDWREKGEKLEVEISQKVIQWFMEKIRLRGRSQFKVVENEMEGYGKVERYFLR